MNAACTVAAQVDAYLTARRRAGYSLRIVGSQLKSFARFAQAHRHRGPVTVDLAVRWAQASRRGTAVTAAARIAKLRAFTQACHRLDPANEVPPVDICGRSYRRVTPHIYQPAEIRALIDAARLWPPRGCLRADSYATLFGLLAATGLRLSEALCLTREDVDLVRGVLTIRQTKFHKSRYVPLHPTTTAILQRYAQRRDRKVRSRTTQAFLLTDQGRPIAISAVQYAFKRLRERLQWKSRGGHRSPRIHDLRHTFIC